MVLSDYIEAPLRRICNTISSKSRKAIFDLSSRLPAELAYFLSGFEFPCNISTPGADLLLSLSKLGRNSVNLLHSDNIAKHTDLKANLLFSSELKDHIDFTWYEYDTGKNDFVPYPSYFWGINQENFNITKDYFTAISKAMGKESSEINPNTIQQISTIVSAMPPESNLNCIGIMLGRKNNAVRLLISSVNPGNIKSFLTLSGYSETGIDNLLQFVSLYNKFFDVFSLQLSIVGGNLSDRIGVECFINNSFDFIQKRKTEILIDKMISSNLLIDNIAGIIPMIPEPVYHDNEINLVSGNQKIRLIETFMGFHHFKFTFTPEMTNPKAYLWFESKWS